MLNKLTLRNRIFTVSFALVLLAVLLIWFFIRPAYERTIIKERSTVISQLQEYTLRHTDYTIGNWLNSVNRLAEDLVSTPENTGDLVQKAVNYTPGLMRIFITDYDSGRNIDAVRTLYNSVNFESPEPEWTPARSDEQIRFFWTENTDGTHNFFITRKDFQVAGAVYGLYMYYNAQPVYRDLLNIPLGGLNETGILTADARHLFNGPGFPFPQELAGDSSFSNTGKISAEDKDWFIYASRFETLPLWHGIAVEESFVLQPVRQLMKFTLITGGLLLIFIFFLSRYVSYRINEPVQSLINDVEYLGKLDFEHPITAVNLPEFRNMYDVLENIRLTLKRYRKLNVEKVILEEWKTRYMITYSNDLIGTVDDNRSFSFVNNNLMALLESLQLNPATASPEDVLNHPGIKAKKSNKSLHYPGAYVVQVEQIDAEYHKSKEDIQYFDVQLISITDENSIQAGAFMLLHNRTDDKKLDIKRNEMILMIAEELKNPAGAVTGISKLLVDNKSMPQEELDILHRELYASGERMNELISRFLEVNDLELDADEKAFEQVNVLQVIKDVNIILHPLLNAKQLNVQLNAEKKSYNINGNKELVFDAIYQLMTNAIKYGDPNRTIVIDISGSASSVTLSITDYGYGINVKEEKRIFEKFYQGSSRRAVKPEKGTGLGLSYVREIMRHHNGEVLLDSRPEIGSKFTLIFPLIP